MLLYRCDECGIEIEISPGNWLKMTGNIPPGWKQTLNPWPGTKRIMASVYDYCPDCVLKNKSAPDSGGTK